MLPTFVIGLREGLEAALIVGIIAAFLRKQGRRELFRWMLAGVGTAILLCLAIGIGLEVLSQNLPQKQQEGLETVIGVLAVGMLTYMIGWMRHHSRGLKGELEGLAANALTSNSGRAMIVMAFLAVLREGFETVVFLLAAFNENNSGAGAGVGAVLGIVIAVGLGYGIYRGGVRINLSKFFRATGLVLVLVAAGLVVSALHTAHEAGWLAFGQQRTIDLTWLVQPGSVQSSLLTGMLGIQPHPVLIELIGWFAYLVPVALWVTWPPGKVIRVRTQAVVGASLALGACVAAMVLAFAAPAASTGHPQTSGYALVSDTGLRNPEGSELEVKRDGSATHLGLDTDVYVASARGTAAAGRPATLSFTEVAALNGGRLPLGLRSSSSTDDSVSVQYSDVVTITAWVEPHTGRVVDVRKAEVVRATAVNTPVGDVPLEKPVATTTQTLKPNGVAAARQDLSTLDRRNDFMTAAKVLGAGAAIGLLVALGAVVRNRRATGVVTAPPGAKVELVRS